MFTLDNADETFAGMTAFYALVNIPRADVVSALCELLRVLKPGGPLLLAFHVGDDVLHRDELWGVQVSLDFYFFLSDEMGGYLSAAGFKIDEIIERDPYPEAVEHQSRRSYIFAHKPGPAH